MNNIFQPLTPRKLARGYAATGTEGRKFDPSRRIARSLDAVSICLDWLAGEGYTPISVEIDAERSFPIINIEVCPECERLKTQYAAYTYGWRPECGQRAILWRTDKFGCRIEWRERGH